MVKKRILQTLSIVFLLLASTSLNSLSPVVGTSIDTEVSYDGEAIQVTVFVTVDEEAQIEFPFAKKTINWRIASQSKKSDRVISKSVNGQSNYKRTVEYLFNLIPLKKGTITLPRFTVNIEDKSFLTSPIEIEVKNVNQKKAGANKNLLPQADPEYLNRFNDLFASEDLGEIFVRGEPNKTKAYVGELIRVPFYIYYKNTHIRNTEPFKYPDFKGFLKEELSIQSLLKQVPVEVNGEIYRRGNIIDYAIFPLKAGSHTISPLTFYGEFYTKNLDDFKDNDPESWFKPNYKNLTIKSKPISIKAIPLPPLEEKLYFTGGVGSFEMKVESETSKPKVGQPFSITVEVSGTGNIKAIRKPRVVYPTGIEYFKTSSTYEFNQSANGFKRFKYLLTADKEGQIVIPSVKWIYFDPDLEEYRDLVSQPIILNVEKNNLSASQIASAQKKLKLKLDVATEITGFRSWKNLFRPLYFDKIWIALGLSYFFLAFTFVFFRFRNIKQAALAKTPWLITEKKIKKKKSWRKSKLAPLIELWCKQKILDLTNDPSLYLEAPKKDFYESFILIESTDDVNKKLAELKLLWTELDKSCFAGARNKEKINYSIWLKKAKAILDISDVADTNFIQSQKKT